MTNYYEVLGVKQDASLDEIKSSYRALQKKYHPDVYKGDNPDYAAEMVKRANEAYSVLSDETRRAEYDQQLKYGNFTGQTYADPYSQSGGNPYRRTYYYTYTRYTDPNETDQQNNGFYGNDPFGFYSNGDGNDPQNPYGFHYVTGRGCLRSLVIMGLVWLGLSLLGVRWIGLPLLFFFF